MPKPVKYVNNIKAYNEKVHQQLYDKYIIDQKQCQECCVSIPYEKRMNDFCSRSCSGTYYARGRPSRKRKGNWTDEQLQEAINNSKTGFEVAQKLGTVSKGDVYRQIKRIGANVDHFKKTTKKSFEELSKIEGVRPATLKKALVRENIMENKCSKCGITKWNDEEAPLELDHIDGNRYNNNILNLRILCRNCHAQTETFGGRNFSKIINFSDRDKELYKINKRSKIPH